MTVESQIPYQSYTANGMQTSFALSFYVEDKGNFFVKKDDTIVSVNDYVYDSTTNSISFNTAPPQDCLVEIERVTSVDRSTTYATFNNSFRPEVLNYDIDRIWRKLQELAYTDSVLFLKLVKEISDRIAVDTALQAQIDSLDDQVSLNTSNIEQLITNLSQEIAARLQADNILKNLFLSIIDTAINEGTVNALAVIHLDSVDELDQIQVWQGRTVYVTDKGIHRYDMSSETWIFLDQYIVKTVESLQDLENLVVWEERSVYVKATNSYYVYDSANTSILSLEGWVLQYSNVISTLQLGISGGDITDLIQFAIDHNLQIEIEKNITATTTIFNQNHVFGRGVLYYNNDPVTANDYSFLAPRSLSPYPRSIEDRTGWYDNVEARGNFENGSGYGLMVNRKGVRPQISGYRTLSGMAAYPSTDICGLYIDVAAQVHKSITVSTTYTSTSVTSPEIVAGINCKKGDFLRTARDSNISNLQWRGWVTDIDYATNTISVAAWIGENGTIGTPQNGISFITPDCNSLWGINTNVYLNNNTPATKIQGFELGVYAETGKTYEAMNGFFAVNLNSTNKATNAFLTSGTWSNGLRTSADNAVYAEGTTAVRWTHNTSGAAIYAQSGTVQGNLIQSVGGSTVRYSMDGYGKQSHNRLDYAIHSASTTHNGLNPSVVFGANASAGHTTTLSTTSMTAGTVFEFKNLQAYDWSIVAGGSTYVLNTSGTMDYLKLYFDGTNFLKIFAGKSL